MKFSIILSLATLISAAPLPSDTSNGALSIKARAPQSHTGTSVPGNLGLPSVPSNSLGQPLNNPPGNPFGQPLGGDQGTKGSGGQPIKGN